MKYISEISIAKSIDLFEENESSFYGTADDLAKNQLAISAALTEENLAILTDEEYDLLWFMIVTLYHSIKEEVIELPIIKPKAFEKAEEQNWDEWNNIKQNGFKSKLDVIFKDYHQEDLLAFVEDSLIPDDDVHISNEGREVIFILCKSLIDVFDRLSPDQ